MKASWEARLDDWVRGGVLDIAAAARVREFEASRVERSKLRWPTVLALAFGALMLFAGILLFVAAHWDTISPGGRFGLVILLVGVFHLAGAATSERFEALAVTFHAIGTGSLGAGIYLAGQIFNMQGDWPAAMLLWAVGAWAGWFFLRQWPQAAFAAVLTPAWLVSKWYDATGQMRGAALIAGAGILLLALTYISTRLDSNKSASRRAIVIIGAIALFPAVLAAVLLAPSPGIYSYLQAKPQLVSGGLEFVGWSCALLVPLLFAYWARGRAAWMNVICAGWVVALVEVAKTGSWNSGAGQNTQTDLSIYALCAAGATGLTVWGLCERHKLRINLGVIGFALTVLIFYFSDVMSKMNRAVSLIGLGILFLLGGYGLERARRALVRRLGEGGV